MAGLNTSQIMDLARSKGISLSESEAQSILNQAWDQSQYGADAEVVNSILGNKSSGSSGSSVSSSSFNLPDIQIPSVEEYIQGIVSMMPQAPTPYSEVNPFYFDEENAKVLAEAQFGPYYDELLADYLGDIQVTMERTQDDKLAAVGELKAQEEYFQEKHQRELDQLLRGVKEGYSNKGLYFSGRRKETEGMVQEEADSNLQDYMRQSSYQERGITQEAQRSLEDLTKQGTRYERDIGREKESSIAENVLQQRQEGLGQYLGGMETYYQNPDWENL